MVPRTLLRPTVRNFLFETGIVLIIADAAQSFQDTTDELTGAFLELKDYEVSAARDVYYYIEQSMQITVVLRPVGLALQTDASNPTAFPNEPTAHELVAWKVRILMVISSILC
jgi:hypothetical protein